MAGVSKRELCLPNAWLVWGANKLALIMVFIEVSRMTAPLESMTRRMTLNGMLEALEIAHSPKWTYHLHHKLGLSLLSAAGAGPLPTQTSRLAVRVIAGPHYAFPQQFPLLCQGILGILPHKWCLNLPPFLHQSPLPSSNPSLQQLLPCLLSWSTAGLSVSVPDPSNSSFRLHW